MNLTRVRPKIGALENQPKSDKQTDRNPDCLNLITPPPLKTNKMQHVLDVEVSYFQDYYDKIPKRVNLYEQLCSWKQYKREIDRLRQETNPDLCAHIKSTLPCITPSGTFSARRNNGLMKHSKLICIDIDAKDNPQITDWERFKVRLSLLPWVAFAALSVSGRGVFLLVPIRYPKRHEEHFEAIRQFFSGKGFRIDSSCRNVSRLRGCSMIRSLISTSKRSRSRSGASYRLWSGERATRSRRIAMWSLWLPRSSRRVRTSPISMLNGSGWVVRWRRSSARQAGTISTGSAVRIIASTIVRSATSSTRSV